MSLMSLEGPSDVNASVKIRLVSEYGVVLGE